MSKNKIELHIENPFPVYCFLGAIIGDKVMDFTFRPMMTELLQGDAWESLCTVLSFFINGFVWFKVVPDFAHGVKIKRMSRVDGSHDKV